MQVLKFIIANNILRLRTDAEMSRGELGEKICYSEDFILKWERAEEMPDDDAVEALAAAFGVDKDYLLNPHDEWLSKEEKEFRENTAAMAPNMETKNVRAAEEEQPAEEVPVKKKKKKSPVPVIAAVVVAAVGILYFSAESGLIGCGSASVEQDMTTGHVHEYGFWQTYTEATMYEEGEMRAYCSGCDEYVSKVTPASTPGIFYEELSGGECVARGIAHSSEFNNNITKIVIPPYIIDEKTGKELRVSVIGSDFISSFGKDCGRISEIILPDTVELISNNAFSGTSISSIELPKSLRSIGNYAFEDCRSLREILIPQNVAYIGEGAFKGCSSLAGVGSMTDNITEISPYTFQKCYNLQAINGFSEVTAIGEYAFEYCEKLWQTDVFSDNLKSIRKCAFQLCKKLDSVKFGKNLIYIGESAFSSCDGLKDISFYSGDDAVNEKLTIAKGAFYYCKGIVELDIKRVDYIGEWAFAGCAALKSVTVEAQTICEGAFTCCELLVNVTLCEGIKEIGTAAFANNPLIKTITIPASVETIRYGAFKDCTNLYLFSTSGTVQRVDNTIFLNCEKLTQISLYDMSGDGWVDVFYKNRIIEDVFVQSGEIPANAFRECTALRYITLGDGVTSIGEWAFADVKNDMHQVGLVLSNNLKSIGNYAFSGIDIYNVTIGESVETVGEYAFYRSNITSVTIESGNTVFGDYAFANCFGLREINFPDDMKFIYTGMFSSSSNKQLTKITLPESVTVIYEDAFSEWYYLSEITISNKVTEIGREAFHYCTNLRKINFGGTKAEWEAINKHTDWRRSAKEDITVVCTDGEVIEKHPY